MNVDWAAALSAILGAAIALLFLSRWRSHERRRDIHFEFGWHTKQREEMNERDLGPKSGQKKPPPDPDTGPDGGSPPV